MLRADNIRPPHVSNALKQKQFDALADDRNDLHDGDELILIIEDDLAFAAILHDATHSKGFKCLIATTGETGVNLANTYKPHAVISDIGLPDIFMVSYQNNDR